MKKALTLSIVIPVYNEQDYLEACLKSIAAQTVKPAQIIVVDNNSTDKTVQIARRFRFVTLLHEKRQGQIFAQATGFNAAQAEIFGRIDADTILPPNWVKDITAVFHNQQTVAISGGADPYDVLIKAVEVRVFYFYHEFIGRLFFGHPMLWGSNLAFRATYWPKLRRQMTFDPHIWEDYEMSVWLAKLGTIRYLPNLKVGCSFRITRHSFLYQMAYQWRGVRTYRLHHNRFMTFLYLCCWYSMIPLFPFTLLGRWHYQLTHSTER